MSGRALRRHHRDRVIRKRRKMIDRHYPFPVEDLHLADMSLSQRCAGPLYQWDYYGVDKKKSRQDAKREVAEQLAEVIA